MVRRKLCSLSEKLEVACSGRKVRAESIHLTLVFLGDMKASQLDTICLAANTVSGKDFDFIIDSIRYWKFNRLVYATAGESPQELLNLVNSLKVAMSANGVSFDNRAFRTHITLVRKAGFHFLPESLCYLDIPILLPVREWILVKSEQVSDRSVYTPIGRWLLTSTQR